MNYYDQAEQAAEQADHEPSRRPTVVIYSDHVMVNGKRFDRCKRAVGIAPCTGWIDEWSASPTDCGGHS